MIYRILFIGFDRIDGSGNRFAQQTEKTKAKLLENHGGPVAAEVYWLIATKRSGCTRGVLASVVAGMDGYCARIKLFIPLKGWEAGRLWSKQGRECITCILT